MVFSSLLFIFFFLSTHLIIYFLVPKKWQNSVLLIYSLVFYGWSGPKYLLLLLAEVGISWFCSLAIESEQRHRRSGKPWLVFDIVLLLLILGFFKYTGFFLDNFRLLFGFPEETLDIVLPLGISFYTFQLLSYTIDVYRKDTSAQKSYSKLLLYAGLFHQCVAGPIVRYETVAKEIDHRSISITDLSEGIRRFSIGLAKKAILANGAASVADTLLPSSGAGITGSTTLGLWLGMLCYMLEIYLDFSAYSDMAIGMGRMVGFHYLENFNYPYTANSVQDFWRKWHISLSTFFRDYVYIPLGGSRVSKAKWVRNIIVVWFLTGMWHGASWNFILWGLYFAVFLFFEKTGKQKKWHPVLRHLYTLVIVYFGWVLFRFDDMSQLGSVLGGMFGFGGLSFTNLDTHIQFINNIFFLLFSIIAVTPLGKLVRFMAYNLRDGHGAFATVMRFVDMLLPAILLFLSACALIGNTYNPFLYFRF